MIGSFIEIPVLTWVMSGGSCEKEDALEQQCQHCGRWFHTSGLHVHEQHCDFQDYEVRLHPLKDTRTIERVSANQ